MAKLVIVGTPLQQPALDSRVDARLRRGPPLTLTPVERAVHFLRGVRSRSTIALTSFHLYHGSRLAGESSCVVLGYPGRVLKHTLEFSSISAIALACRKAFDHDPKKVTGSQFAKSSDATIQSVAEYWANKSNRPVADACSALIFLRSVFAECSRSDNELLKEKSTLARRIGLLKQYANRSSAHLSMEGYEFDIFDCAHVVCALVLLSEITRSFDASEECADYFDNIEAAGLAAAQQIFPGMGDAKLLKSFKAEEQARVAWQWGHAEGRKMLFERLPRLTGWF